MKKSHRYIILIIMLIITALCGMMMPRININSDMTQYLPEDSRMRQGIDTMKVAFPLVDMNAPSMRAMFRDVDNPDSLGKVLSSTEGVARLISVREKDGMTLYEMYVTSFPELSRLCEEIPARFENCVALDSNANSNMPEGMGKLLIAGCLLIFGILFAMCASFAEAVLFIVTIGLAVIINMGTNAFLPSVSMMTNTIVGVLQFVLSMDYSIILMSRYRQERLSQIDSAKAMSQAIRKASSSILSSSFTTIVGLLALVFMKFRIGLDLGVVLAKGVFCSLVSIYTILPALILLFEKLIDKTRKKVPTFPTNRLARGEVRFRWVLTAVFVLLFAGAFLLQRRTQLSYASIWETPISDVFPTQTKYMLLYRTADEDKVPALLDSLSRDANVVSALSYPSIMKTPLTATELYSFLKANTDSLPVSEDNIRMLYYASSHPERSERMSFSDMLELATRASADGLLPSDAAGFIPEGMNMDELKAMMATPIAPAPSAPASVAETLSVPQDTALALTDTIAAEIPELSVGPGQGASAISEPVSKFTAANCTEQLHSSEMAEFLGFKAGQASAIYNMAGRKNSTMSAVEFIGYVNEKIVPNRLFSRMISKEQLAGLAETSALIAEATSREEPSPTNETSLYASAPSSGDSVSSSDASASLSGTTVGLADSSEAVSEKPEEKVVPSTPMETLASMAASGKKYSSETIYRSLEDAGFAGPETGLNRDMVNLMFMYYGFTKSYDEETRLSVEQFVTFLTGTVLKDPMYAAFIDDAAREAMDGMDEKMSEGLGQLRSENWSMAALVTNYSVESDSTFRFVEKLKTLSSEVLSETPAHYVIGESVMYKEMKDGFSRELILLTILTVGSIFLIVLLTFRSLLIPLILVLAVMSGVYVNVFVSGLGGNTMLYLAYLIVQSILMGATIDYAILFTNIWRELLATGMGKKEAMMETYHRSMPTIMTSGLILVFAPYIMSLVMSDPSISSILSSLSIGAAAALLVIIFLLPSTLAAFVKAGK